MSTKLTVEQVKAMEPGREMDAAVAKHVMNWPRIGPNDPFRLYRQHGGVICDSRPMRFPDHPPEAIIPEPWFPSTDIAAAWEVVEKMRANGYDLMLQTLASTHNVHGASFWKRDGDRSDPHGSGFDDESAATAICRAALMAVLPHAPTPAAS